MRLDIHKQWRDHANRLLTRYIALRKKVSIARGQWKISAWEIKWVFLSSYYPQRYIHLKKKKVTWNDSQSQSQIPKTNETFWTLVISVTPSWIHWIARRGHLDTWTGARKSNEVNKEVVNGAHQGILAGGGTGSPSKKASLKRGTYVSVIVLLRVWAVLVPPPLIKSPWLVVREKQ